MYVATLQFVIIQQYVYVILVLEMYQNDLIPKEAVTNWEDLGIELGFSYAEIDEITKDATQKSVESCSKEMLKMWQKQEKDGATAEELIRALIAIHQNAYAEVLKNG